MLKLAALLAVLALALVGCASTTKSSEGKARFAIIARKSSCWEMRSYARAYAVIYVKNKGTASGKAEVYNWFRYSDSGLALAGPDTFTIAPHRTNVFRIVHDYNALKHDVIECHAMIGLNGTETPIRVR